MVAGTLRMDRSHTGWALVAAGDTGLVQHSREEVDEQLRWRDRHLQL